MKYIVTGPTIINDIAYADGSRSRAHLGGSIFCVAGIKLWEDDCLYVSNVGDDFSEYYGKWMERNHCSFDGLQYTLPHTQYTELKYDEEGLHSEESIYGKEEERLVEQKDLISAGLLASYCDESTRGIYIEASESNPFWEETERIRSRSNARIMWELPTSAAVTPSCRQKVFEVLEKTDMYSVNLPEAKALFDVSSEEEALNRIKELGIPCFFRVGSRGSYMVADGEAAFAKSLTVGEIVDPTGCGNCSTAAAMYGFCEGLSLYKTAASANISAAYNLLQYGPYPEVNDAVRKEAHRILAEKYSE